MSAKDPRRSRSERKAQPSVVGSTVRDVSTRLRGRGLPKGGIREKDGLKVAEGALPDSTVIGSSDGRGGVGGVLRAIAAISALLVVVLIALAIALAILSGTSAFSISKIEAFDSDHITADEVARLAVVDENATLLNVDIEALQAGVKRNPWAASVNVERVFPDTLRLRVHERSLGAVVAMNSGGIAWLLGDDDVWIEPLKFEVNESESANDAALNKATELGVILISDVPSSVSPSAGSPCSDESIQAVMSLAGQLSDSLKEQVVCYSASSEDDISLILKNGVEVSMGSSANIDTKESVATRILEEFGGQVTYINVRIPSRPTYRRVNSEYVREGTGATGNAVEEESIVPKVKAYEEDEEEGEEHKQSEEQPEESAYSDYDDEYYYE